MSILNALRASLTASKLSPNVIKNIKRLEGVKGDLTPLNVDTIVLRSEVSLTDSQRTALLSELQKSEKFKGSNLEFNLQRFEKIRAKDKPNPKFLAERQQTLDNSIHIQVLKDLLEEQPDPGRVNPFPEGLDTAVPIPESQFNILGKIEEKLQKPPAPKPAPTKQPKEGPVVVDFKSLTPVKPDEPQARLTPAKGGLFEDENGVLFIVDDEGNKREV